MRLFRPPFTRQPQGGLRLDRGNPLARSITHCLPLNGNSYEIVSGSQITRGSGYLQNVDSRGVSVKCAGSAACASVPLNLAGQSKLAVSFWLYWDTNAGDDDFAFEFGNGVDSSTGFTVDANSSFVGAGGCFEVACHFSGASGGDGYGTKYLTGGDRPSAAAWHHYAFNLSTAGTTGIDEVYVDGVVTAPNTGATTTQSGTMALATLYLFSRTGTALFGAGRLQNFFVRAGYAMSAAEVLAEYRNPWQVYAPPLRRFWAPSSGATSAALTGNAATGSPGTVTPSMSVPITGNGATGSPGTVAPTMSLALTGNAGTGSPGTVAPEIALGVTGNTGTGSPGTMSPELAFGVTGNEATGSVGDVGPNITIELTGNGAVGEVGTVTAPGGTTTDITGNEATGSVGSVGVAMDVALTGNTATGSPGTLTPTVDAALTGNEGTGSPGTVGANITVALTGNAATGEVGTMIAPGDLTIALTGVGATGEVGTMVASGGGVNPLDAKYLGGARKNVKFKPLKTEAYAPPVPQPEVLPTGEVLPAMPLVPVPATTGRGLDLETAFAPTPAPELDTPKLVVPVIKPLPAPVPAPVAPAPPAVSPETTELVRLGTLLKATTERAEAAIARLEGLQIEKENKAAADAVAELEAAQEEIRQLRNRARAAEKLALLREDARKAAEDAAEKARKEANRIIAAEAARRLLDGAS